MKSLSPQPNLVEQVQHAIVAEIASGKLAPGGRIIQEQLATALGVSRQPVQQALLLLRQQGLLNDAPGRGLVVAPIDPAHVQHMYDMRAVVEGLACRLVAQDPDAAARAAALGPALIDAGRKAVASGSVAKMVAADIRFHEFIYGLCGNPLIAPAMNTHWSYTQRVMADVLVRDEAPRDIWDQHERILKALAKGDAEAAENLARKHITQAAAFIVTRLRQEGETPAKR